MACGRAAFGCLVGSQPSDHALIVCVAVRVLWLPHLRSFATCEGVRNVRFVVLPRCVKLVSRIMRPPGKDRVAAAFETALTDIDFTHVRANLRV